MAILLNALVDNMLSILGFLSLCLQICLHGCLHGEIPRNRYKYLKSPTCEVFPMYLCICNVSTLRC